MKNKTSLSIGQKIDKLTVQKIWTEKLNPNRSKETITECLCDCGNTTIRPARYLKKKCSQSCGCINYPCNKKHSLWKGYGEISMTFWNEIQGHTKRYNQDIPFKVSIEYAWELYQNQEGKCSLSGIPINFSYKSIRYDSIGNTVSLDRIDSTKGYIEGNVQWVHKDVNMMKNELDEKEFIYWCTLVAKNQENIRNSSNISQIFNRKTIKKHKNRKGFEDISGTFWSVLKKGAKKRDLEFNLDIKEAWDLFIKQRGACSLTGVEIGFSDKIINMKEKQTASVDRIDNKLGYTINNIQWVHKKINIMKYTFSQEEFVRWCVLVASSSLGKHS